MSDDYFEVVAHSQKTIDILFKAVESKDSVFKFVSLNLFHRLYNYLNDDIIQKFVDIIKQDKKYVRNLLNEPILLANAWIYYNPTQLFSIRVAVILEIMREQCRSNSKVTYEDLRWISYLEEIIIDMVISKTSLTYDNEQKIFYIIIKFLKNAFEKDGKLTRETIGNCVQTIEESII